MVSIRDILINLIGKETISPAAKRSEKALGDLGDEMGEAAKAAKVLDGQIVDVQKSLREMAIASASGEDVKRQIREQERALRDLTKRRKLLGDVGGEAAEQFSLAFATRIGPLMARAPLSPGLLAAAAGAAPLVANVLAGAVTGAIGGGAVAAGLAIAARDARVQAEAKSLADQIGEQLEDAAAPFVPATIKALGIVRRQFDEMDGDLEAIFEDASEYLDPLTRAATGFVRELVPGIRDGVREAGPFFEMLERELPELGADAGKLFSTMADHADDGAEAVGQMLDLMGALATATGVVVDGLALVKDLGNLDPTSESHWADKFFGKNKGVLIELKKDSEDAAGGIQKVEDAAGEAATKVELLSAAIERMSNENLDARAAVRNLEAAYDAATEAVKENGETLDESTPKGRANAEALDRIVREAKRARDAIIAQKGSQGEVNEVMAEARKRFVKVAEAMGMDAIAAKKLADQLFGIPSVNPKIKVDPSSGKAAVKDFLALYAKVKNKSVTISGRVRWTSSGLKVPGGTILEGFAGGGPITGPGPKGVDSRLIAAAPGEHMWSAEEVDAAGGHAAVERLRKSVLSGQKAAVATGGVAMGAARSAPAPTVVRLEVGAGRPDPGRAVAELVMTLIRTGALRLTVRDNQVRVG